MKIYFAGSMYGSFEDEEWCFQIIRFLNRYGGEVLTENLAHRESPQLGEKKKSILVYERNTEWLKEADVMIAEVTTPSLEVGYEIGLAESLGKPVLCFFRKRDHNTLSPLIAGNGNLVVRQYASQLDIEKYIKYFFKHLKG